MINNILLILCEVIICGFSLIYISKKLDKVGLYIWIILMNILTIITIVSRLEILGLDIPLGLVSSANIFTAINILIQKYGKDELTDVLTSIYVTSFVTAFIMYSSVKLNIDTINSLANSISNSLFFYDVRLVFARILALIISIWINFKIYYSIRKTRNKYWISNIYSSIMVNFVDSVLFIGLSFIFKMDIKNVIIIMIISSVIKIIIGIINTSVMYMDNRLSK